MINESENLHATATRKALIVMVEREQKKTGSRKRALASVSRSIGTSPSWLQKFIGCHDEVAEPRISLFVRIRRAYEEMCSRVEKETHNELALIAALRGELNEVDRDFVELVAGTRRERACSWA